ncbi:hypothetical protein [uncultured Roseivirga sp.]|uniref:hypothetical protein n=1 Tax=uncultured Roseivirga sp. TaxID=543088 RepID=UPI000D7A76FB|nr:hypothetical protein [uncultured Roseivirga sp.]PWL30211.1 MAG: hypothetical protein DCO95_10295 [Roseivirga sp. XM-24bin3]
MKISKALFLWSILIFAACGNESGDQISTKEKSAEVNEITSAQLVLKDSIMIDVIAGLNIYDYNSKTGLFLAGDVSPGGVIFMGATQKFNTLGHLVINRKGEIVHQFKRNGNGPEEFGGGALDNFFLGDSSVAVLSKTGLFQYAIDGNFQKKYKNINGQDLVGYSNYKVGVSDNNGNLAIGLAKGMDDATRAWDSLFQIVKPMRFYDLKAFETGYETLESGEKAKYGYPDHPHYYPESKFGVQQMPPHVAYNSFSDEVYAVYPTIRAIEVYDMETGDFKKRIDTQPDFFGEPVETGTVEGAIGGYEGLAWMNRGGRLASSNYHEIDQIGQYTLLRYNTALPEDILNPLLAKGYNKDERWPAVRRQNYKFYYQLFKDGKKVLPDFELPELEPQEGQVEFIRHNQTRGVVIGGDGLESIYVFMPNDGDVERDYELIYVYELRLK